LDEKGNQIAVGCTAFNNEEVEQLIGKSNFKTYCSLRLFIYRLDMESNNIFQSIKEASKDLLLLDKEHTNQILWLLADETEQQFDLILKK